MWCHCQVKIFLGLRIWAAGKPNAVSYRFPVGRHVNAAYSLTACATDRQWSRRVRKNDDPILSCLWTEVHEILGHRKRPFVVSNARPRLSISRFFVKVAVKLQTCWKTSEAGCFGSQFQVVPQILGTNFQITLTFEHVAGFGWVPFTDLAG